MSNGDVNSAPSVPCSDCEWGHLSLLVPKYLLSGVSVRFNAFKKCLDSGNPRNHAGSSEGPIHYLSINKLLEEEEELLYVCTQGREHEHTTYIKHRLRLARFKNRVDNVGCVPRAPSNHAGYSLSVYFFNVLKRTDTVRPLPILRSKEMEDTENFKPSWLEMSEAKLRKHLFDLKYPPPLIRDALVRHRFLKAKRKAERTRLTVLQQRWDDVLRPARTELATVRTMKSQLNRVLTSKFGNAQDQEKFNALCAYEDVLVKVVARLRAFQKANEHTPQQVAEEFRKEGVMPMPYNGTHWTEYVGGKARHRVEAMFDALPDPARGRKKRPFERRISPEEHDRLARVLSGQISHEEDGLNDRLSMTKDPDQRKTLEDRLYDVQKARYLLEILPRTMAVPTHWRALLGMEI